SPTAPPAARPTSRACCSPSAESPPSLASSARWMNCWGCDDQLDEHLQLALIAPGQARSGSRVGATAREAGPPTDLRDVRTAGGGVGPVPLCDRPGMGRRPAHTPAPAPRPR